MTLEISSTHLVQLTPEFPMYLKCPINEGPDNERFTYFLFTSETVGIYLWNIGKSSIISHANPLKGVLECYKQMEPSDKIEFQLELEKAQKRFAEIVSEGSIMIETTYPLNAVL